MKLEGTRFGSIEISDEDIVAFPKGLLGFKELTRFVLLPHRTSPSVAWLLSVDMPSVALPVVSAHATEEIYDDATIYRCLAAVGTKNPDDVAMLLVMTAAPGLPPTVNRRAPVILNAETRTGVQMVLEDSTLSTRATLSFIPELLEATAA